MKNITYNDKNYNIDDEGFLNDYNQWDENFAILIASKLGMLERLSEKQWAIIHFIRDSFYENGKCPNVYETCKANKLTWMELKEMFPTGYQRGACLIAGVNYRDRIASFYRGCGSVRTTEQSELEQREKGYQIDADGFLLDPSEWDEEFAINKALEMKIPGGLTDKHWKIIYFLRDNYQKNGIVPTVFECCESNNIDLEGLEKLFPDGYHRCAVKISGLRVVLDTSIWF
jgi:TusE/DsrC/DsvC family sulfur relay protein